MVKRLWNSRVVVAARGFVHRWPVLVAFVLFAGTVAIAFGLDARQTRERAEADAAQRQEIADDFRHDTTLNDYGSCRSGNRIRQAILDQNDGTLAVLAGVDREAAELYLSIWREALDDFAPRDCSSVRALAVKAGATDAELRAVEQAPPPPPVSDLPLATCEGIGPFVRGQDAAYLPELDRDGDGVSCEQGG